MGLLRVLSESIKPRWLATMLLLVAAGCCRADDAPYVAAAADLKFALEEIGAAYTRETGGMLRLSFGSSGNFARQIAQGAPFELFLSADEQYALGLFESGRALDRGALYGVGRIVVFARRGSPLKPAGGVAAIAAALDGGTLRRFAIANPEHAPYGRAAREALQHAGLWQRLQGRLLLGENAAQAAQFAASDSADGGIVPLSLALAPALRAAGEFELIPEDQHRPLRQRMVLLKGAGESARRFYDYLQRPAARAVLARNGLQPPP